MKGFLDGVTMTLLFPLLSILSLAFPMKMTAEVAAAPAREQIRILPVPRSAESTTVRLAIAVPKMGELLRKNPVWIQLRVDGFALGAGSSQFERAQEVANSKMGQTIHVIVDDYPYFAVNEPALDPFDESGYYYDTSYKVEVPFSLKTGMHTIRMFPARSYGESLKGEGAFQVAVFYLGDKEKDPHVDLRAPYLTYNEPSDQMELVEGMPVLLDFLISNCELSGDGYKVQLTVDGRIKRMLSSWQPYYIYGLTKGKHKIKLELVDAKGARVPGTFNSVERIIEVKGQ